jgi:hypothetical protein
MLQSSLLMVRCPQIRLQRRLVRGAAHSRRQLDHRHLTGLPSQSRRYPCCPWYSEMTNPGYLRGQLKGHGRGKFKDASRLRPTTPEDSLSSHSTDLIQPAVDRHPSNFTLDLSGDLVSCAVSPDQRHLVFLYRSSIKVFNVMSLCQSLRPGVSIKAPPSYIVESIEPIRTFSLGANHLWAVIDKDRCKVNSESLASS